MPASIAKKMLMIAVREGDVADLDAKDVRVLAEHEVAAHHRGDEHHDDAERFDEWAHDALYMAIRIWWR